MWEAQQTPTRKPTKHWSAQLTAVLRVRCPTRAVSECWAWEEARCLAPPLRGRRPAHRPQTPLSGPRWPHP